MKIEAELSEMGGTVREATPSIGVLVVDPHPCFAAGLSALLDFFHDGTYVVGKAATLAEISRMSWSTVPDVLVIDVAAARIDDWRPLSSMCQQPLFPRVIVLADTVDGREAIKAFAAGVAGYVHKDLGFEELVCAVRLVRAGQMIASPPVLQALISAQDSPKDLTDQERCVLRHVAQGRDNDEIARLVAVSPSTLKRILQKVVAKLDAHNRIHAAVVASKTGLI